MTTLNFSLPEELKKWVEAQVSTGGYGNTSEYIRELIRRDQERAAEQHLERLLIEGLQSGNSVEVTQQYWEQKTKELVARARDRRQGRKESPA